MRNPFKKSENSGHFDSTLFESKSSSQKSAKSAGLLAKLKKSKADPVYSSQPIDTRHDAGLNDAGFSYADDAPSLHASSAPSGNEFDPYTAPSAAPMAESYLGVQYKDSEWYAANGRIGRVKALAYGFIWGIVMLIIILISVILSPIVPILSGVVLIGLLPVLVYTYILVPRRRLHDSGMSGLWLLLWLVPIGNLYLLYLLYLKAGDVGANEYGLPAPAYTTLEKVLAILSVLGFVVGLVFPFLFAAQMDKFVADIYPEQMGEAVVLEEVNVPDSGDTVPETPVSEVDNTQPTMDTTQTEIVENAEQEVVIESGVAPVVPDPTVAQVDANADPEVQAAIDAALGNKPESDGGNVGSISYEEFMKMSETSIMVDESPVDEPSPAE